MKSKIYMIISIFLYVVSLFFLVSGVSSFPNKINYDIYRLNHEYLNYFFIFSALFVGFIASLFFKKSVNTSNFDKTNRGSI